LYDPWQDPRIKEQETAVEQTTAQEAAIQEAVMQKAAGPRFPQDKSAVVRNRKTPEEVWDDFTVYLERMIAVQEVFETPAESARAGLGYAYATLALLRPVIGGSGDGASGGDASGAVVESDASGADAVSLAVHWQLDRKLREILCRLGMDGESARHAVEILKVMLSRRGVEKDAGLAAPPSAAKAAKTAPAAKKQSAKDLARQLILDNYGDDDFRRILGINVFDDVTWFNKEAFERALYYGSIYAAMENGDAALIKAAADELRKAEKLSGYRLDAFIEALAGDADKRGKIRRVKK
jgi:hypothetical protein